jgi:aminoglycoside phosphotransferase (APT) family kinase protein
MDEPRGIKVESVSKWMAREVPGAQAPFSFELIAGGRSNLTYRVTGADGKSFALRRPPTSHVLPTAHDMTREHRIIAALHPTGIPVPEPYALCIDEAVNERPFYVMEFVEGHILRDRPSAEASFTESIRASIGLNLADTLAQLHNVDVDAVGLGELGRKEGYIERQLKRWMGQFDQMQVEGAKRLDIVAEVGQALAAAVPVQQASTVVHGDYRLDNTVLNDEGKVTAILDWEICTLGDPLADLGLLLVYWAEAGDGDEVALLGVAPTQAEGFTTRAQILERYASQSSLDLSRISYYQAFGYWKLACILQGVYARYLAGASAGDTNSVEFFPIHIETLARTAASHLEA